VVDLILVICFLLIYWVAIFIVLWVIDGFEKKEAEK
jgi:uncharacterized protein HemY